MAANLARAGFTVLGVDTVPAARDRAAAAGVRVVDDIASLARGVGSILTRLPDPPDVEACLLGPGGVAEYVRPGTLIIEASTIAPATTRPRAPATTGRYRRPTMGASVGVICRVFLVESSTWAV